MRASAVTTRQHGGRSAAGSRHMQFSKQQQAGAMGSSRHPCCHVPPAAAAATIQRQHSLTTNSSSNSSLGAVTAAPLAPAAAAVATVPAASAAAAAAPAVAEAAAAPLQLTSAQADAALRLVHLQRMGSHLERAYLLQQPVPYTPQQQQQQQPLDVTPPQQQPPAAQHSSQQPAPLGLVPAPAAAAAVAAAGPVHQWGQGLSVGQFTAALQALPMQQRVRWKSVYPAIGSGARGKVYQAINLDTGGMLAVKVVSLQHLMGPGPEAALRREALVLELAAMQDYTHPHLLAMQGFYFRSGSSKPRLEIFSELGCCLEDIMPDEGEAALQLGLVQKVMAALLGALDFLHGRGVVHRDVKPGNVVSVGASGTFKLIDMDSVFHTQTWDEEDEEEEEEEEGEVEGGTSPGGQDSNAAVALEQGGQGQQQGRGEESTKQQQQQPQPQQQQQQQQLLLRRSVGVAPGGGMGTPCPASLSAHLAAGAAGRQQQQQQQKQQQKQQKQQGDVSAGALTALSFAGTPDNMAPEAAPTVVRLPLVLWDLFPLRAGEQVASSAAVAPAQDIWSSGTVLYELLTGRSLFSGLETPEALYQHLCALRGSGQALVLPGLPAGLDRDVVEVLEACLQVDPAARPTAKQLLEMEFFNKSY